MSQVLIGQYFNNLADLNREYALNLKREFPRIPFYPDFWAWAAWGEDLMDLHIGYEKVRISSTPRMYGTSRDSMSVSRSFRFSAGTLRKISFTYWRDGKFYLGFLNQFPDYETQARTKKELTAPSPSEPFRTGCPDPRRPGCRASSPH